jgi:phospholipase/carboxylesterase
MRAAMTYAINETQAAVTLEPATPATAAVIWLHGLGADGYDFVPIVDELKLPAALAVRFVFPHAEPRPVTINNGFVMRAWYDIKGLNREGAEDDAGIRGSELVVRRYIEAEVAKGIPASRIVIAGFSQGGAIALQTALRYDTSLAGVMALSTYLPLRASLAAEASAGNRAIPILMCHGTQDGVVPPQMGELSRDALTQLGYRVEWRAYPMQHSVCLEEIADISRWLQQRLSTTAT